MVLSRRVGRMRETFPVLIGTLVSQTAINILALVLLGGIIVSTTDLFQASTQKLFLVSTAPLLILLAVLIAAVARQGERQGPDRARDPGRSRRDPAGAPGTHGLP